MANPSLLTAGAFVGYAVLMAVNPVRSSLRDGLRCVRRYPQIWLIPATFALAHGIFRLWRREYEVRLMAAGSPAVLPWAGWQPPAWTETLAATWLPAAESTAAIFNCAVTTFPLSALAALLFAVNWRGYQVALYRALRRRFGIIRGVAAHLALLVCALAALCKPCLFGGLPILNGYLGAGTLVPLGEWVDSLSFVFEYLLGVSVQIYLVLLSFAWIRGMTFDFDALRRFALRRFAFVVKWAFVVILISSLGIGAPLIVSAYESGANASAVDRAETIVHQTRVLLCGALILFCSMQLRLIFHNESLRRAWRDHFRLLRHHFGQIGWLIVVVAVHFFMLVAADQFLPVALGLWTWPSAGWSLFVYPLLWTALAAWFVASWVCLFQRCERNLPDADELVRY